MADLRDEVPRTVPAPLARLAGLPTAESSAALLTGLAEEIEL